MLCFEQHYLVYVSSFIMMPQYSTSSISPPPAVIHFPCKNDRSLENVEIFLDENDWWKASSCWLLFFVSCCCCLLLDLSLLGCLSRSRHNITFISWCLLLRLLHCLSGCDRYYLLPLWNALQIVITVWIVLRGVSQLLSHQTLTLIKSLLERATDDTVWGGVVLWHEEHHRRMRLLLRLSRYTSCY